MWKNARSSLPANQTLDKTGKSTLCETQLPQLLELPFSYISFDDPDERLRFQRAAIPALSSLATPLVILDEVQKIPQLFDPLKLVVDRERKAPPASQRKFVLTGSSQLLMMKNIRETLAGRVALCELFPFSLLELTGQKGSSFSPGSGGIRKSHCRKANGFRLPLRRSCGS
jgi:predicted AAA+ superfamily ATPase